MIASAICGRFLSYLADDFGDASAGRRACAVAICLMVIGWTTFAVYHRVGGRWPCHAPSARLCASRCSVGGERYCSGAYLRRWLGTTSCCKASRGRSTMTRQAAAEAHGLMNAEPTAVIDLFLCWLLDQLAAGVMSWLKGRSAGILARAWIQTIAAVRERSNSQRLQRSGTGVRPAR
jgi:hypothetical protein